MAGLRWADKHWDAHLAHAAVSRAVRDGRLTPTPCEVPGCTRDITVGHHDDYTKQLDVRWLCDSHHRLWHIEHPVEYEVLRPPSKAAPPAERIPNRGKHFHRYLKPRANYLRTKWGYSYEQIAQELGVSISTAHTWCAKKE